MTSLSSIVYCLFSKARSLSYSGAPERFFNRVGSCFRNRHQTRLERLAMPKHYSLLQKYVNYDCKKFYNIETQVQCYKTFYHSNLPPFHGHTIILCYKTLSKYSKYHIMAVNNPDKKFYNIGPRWQT
jgi:hypothetical protein